MITEQYVEFETAKLLKEKGFVDEYGEGYYTKKGEIQFQQLLSDLIEKEETYYCDAPTQSLVLRWLREVHNIHINIVFLSPSLKWTPTIWKIDTKIPESHHIKSTMNTWETYEEATEIAIKYCLENLI